MHNRIFLHASTSPRCGPLVCPSVRTHRRAQNVVRSSSATSSEQTSAPVQQPQAVVAFQHDGQAGANQPVTSGGQMTPQGWDYKYPHLSCASICDPSDSRGLKLEALFQHVLGYPRLPARVYQFLPRIPSDISTMTTTVEGLSRRYGRELVLYFLRRYPNMLDFDLDTLVSRAEQVRSMLDLRPSELLMVLRKNPNLFILEPAAVRTRYAALHKVLPLNHDSVRRMVHKFPLILNYQTASVESLLDALRQLSFTRVQWQQDFDLLTPSLLAYYFRDSRDILARMEYLIATGESAHIDIKSVCKMSTNLFSRKHRSYRAWRHMREQRRQQQLLRQSMSQQAAESMRATAAAAKQQGPMIPAEVSGPAPAQQQARPGRTSAPVQGSGSAAAAAAAAVAQWQGQGQEGSRRKKTGK